VVTRQRVSSSVAPSNGRFDSGEFIDRFIAEHHIAVFSKTWCPYCRGVKSLFDDLGATYGSVELDNMDGGSTVQQTLLEKTGQRTVPSVFIGGKHVGGYDDTVRLLDAGKLEALIRGPS